MSSKFQLSLNSKVGLLITIISMGGYAWTFTSSLRSMELFVPRISLILMAVGGVLVPIREILKPETKVEFKMTGKLPCAIAIAIFMWAYSWSFRNIGLATSTFAFLFFWWLWTIYREAKRKKDFSRFAITAGKMAALALVVAIVIHILFIELLSMYMPRTPLP
ncbi:tripartite tricarboxylate transporter TctB family protein [Tindallia californiensis]|uniref:Tripartite tricarboxylate transporter TctB family protein n=1 Tax=Tindallia californiensis TaxID=159292 RepID=A0A1H3J3Q7_9FIRM|nr:tripartite tricarboxylate transporter TctB family protein [Tindallia californiensis]SDY34437.1 Tripartite tricarboxylate transporter TctB family protein [Tindallia californiensis]